MNTRKILVAGAALALLTLVAAWFGLATEVPAEAPSSASTPVRFDFPRGRSWTYRLEYEADSHVTLSEAGRVSSLTGKVHLVGELVLRGYGRQGTTHKVGLRLENLQKHSLLVFGQEVLPDATAADAIFRDREAVLDMSAEGEVLAVSFREDDPSLFKNTVQSLVGELQVVLQDGAAWTVEESTTRGRARTEYSRLGEDEAMVHVLKRRMEYVELKGLGQGGTVKLASHFEAAVAREGVLERLAGDERVERLGADGKPAASTHVRVSLARGTRGSFDASTPVELAASQRMAPGMMVVDPKVQKQMLTQQVDGLPAEKLVALLTKHANGGVLPDHNHFLLQATGLLEQQPELCAKMVELFKEPSFDARGRALLLDLLAGTGTPEAQTALVQALSTQEARHDAQYHMLLSRLSLVTEPTVDTVRFAEQSYGNTQGDLRISSAYVLGATAGALYRQEKSPEALATLQRLATDLRATESPKEQAHLLLSLGNAGVPEQAPLIASYARSDSPEVRRAAAKALRKIQTPEAARALMSLMADTAAPVQGTAMEALGRRTLDADTLVRLRDLSMTGAVKVENYHVLVTLVEPYLHTEPAVRDLLEYLLTQDVPDRQIRTRIRGLLES